METQDDTPARVLELVREHSGKEYALVDRAKAGEQGAYIIEERSGERFILKFSRTAESTPQGVRQITSRLSAIGYPIPEYVNVGSASGLGWVIQSMLRGTPRPALTRTTFASSSRSTSSSLDAVLDSKQDGLSVP